MPQSTCRVHARRSRRTAISPEEYAELRDLIESQSLRVLRRHFDYGRRIRTGSGLPELAHWIQRILHGGDSVYAPQERAAAFEIAACEALASDWEELRRARDEPLMLTGRVDRLLLYRCLLHSAFSLQQRAGLVILLQRDYRRHAEWISRRAHARAQEGDGGNQILWRDAMTGFVEALDELVPIPAASVERQNLREEMERLREEGGRLAEELAGMRKDLEFARDRAERAHARWKATDSELGQARRQLRAAREATEQLRAERRARIRAERQSATVRRELTRLKAEYVKLDRRLQDMATRLAQAGNGEGRGWYREIAAVCELPVSEILAVPDAAGADQISQVRRRFAAVFHPDRVKQLPPWAQELCDEILAAVNQACDRASASR